MGQPPTIDDVRKMGRVPLGEPRECSRCGHCCNKIDLNLIPPPDVVDLLSARLGRSIDRILIRASHGCVNLIENPKTKGKYKCKIYNKRPLICQEFQCDYMLGADIGRHVEFRIKSEDII